MRGKRLRITIAMFLSTACMVFGDSVTISDIDNSMLLVNQTIGMYVRVTDDEGQPIPGLSAADFSLFESVPGRTEEEREIIEFRQGINMSRGITLFLLVDNSGSMYDTAAGTQTEDESAWRITFAKNALLSFLDEIRNPADRVGMASFNVRLGDSLRPTTNIVDVKAAISEIHRPGEREGFTELYESIYQSVEIMKGVGGRKVILLLSDGENYPLEGNPHISERRGLDDAVAFARNEGISVFSIGLSRGADVVALRNISRDTGGAFFSIYDPQRLDELYDLIRLQILNEYWMAFRGGMEPSVKKNVRLLYGDGAENQREYFSDTLLGLPHYPVSGLLLPAVPLAVFLLWLLSRLKFEKKQEMPSLQILSSKGRERGRVLTLAGEKRKISIGSHAAADLTVMEDSSDAGATLVRNGTSFTITGDHIKVNNRTVKKKTLKSGDVITVGETTVVFDEGTAKTIVK